MFGDAFGGQNYPKPTAPKDIELTLHCTLYELYNGCLKKIAYERDVLQHDAKTTKKVAVEMNIEVKPGFSEQTRLQFSNQGNEAFSFKPSKLIVKIS